MRLEVLVKTTLPYKKYTPDLSLLFKKRCLMCTMWTIPEHKRAAQKARCGEAFRVLALQKSLAHTNIFVEQYTINKTLFKYGVHGWKHQCTLEVCKRACGCWGMFCGQMKPELSCLEGTHIVMCGGEMAWHTLI